jgi:DNA-binding MarR family transcriptional regulator
MSKRPGKILNPAQRIAGQLDRIEAELHELRELLVNIDPRPQGAVSAEWVRGLIKARRRREKVFRSTKFTGAPWDILLELYAVALTGELASMSDICRVAGVSWTTALRWMNELEDSGLVVRTPDTVDRRRVFVSLSPEGLETMREYLEEAHASEDLT